MSSPISIVFLSKMSLPLGGTELIPKAKEETIANRYVRVEFGVSSYRLRKISLLTPLGLIVKVG